MPFLAARISGSLGTSDRLPRGFIEAAKALYYDTAGATNRGALASLLELVSLAQILFGTDFPPGGSSLELADALAAVGLFDPGALRDVERENALRLLPTLRRGST